MSDPQIVDDRHTTGMRGSGSVSTIAEQGVAPLTHLQVAGAMVRVDAAGFPVGRTADLIDTKEAADFGWCRRWHVVAACCAGPADRAGHQGAEPARDHAPDANFEPHGRLACGPAPHTQHL
ncbi:hypothetical protein [Streptomyces klenkii]|uniref:hypothetical protein n=1 Tax=Streptomyces klenkii TaxID=1420899 RepID=UPI003437F6E4